MLNRFIYLGYHILKTPRKDFYRIFHHIKKEKNISSLYLYRDILFCSLRYNISLSDYFKLRFFNIPHDQRKDYAGSGFMYQYHMLMNPRGHRDVLENKIKFLDHFKEFAGREWSTYEKLVADEELISKFLNNKNGKVVLKNSKGQAGKEVMVFDSRTASSKDLLKTMVEHNYDLIEEFVVQHDVLMKIAPKGLNTIRIITQLHKGKIDIIGTSLRFSVEKDVDNISVGGLVVLIDTDSGLVTGPGYYTDATKSSVEKHPLTQEPLDGFIIPFWQQCVDLVKKAQLLTPENHSIGWDIAVTKNGPILIEGNHNWNTGVWQLPLQKGMKPVLLQYLNDRG